jgi:signal transduction histidine kinase
VSLSFDYEQLRVIYEMGKLVRASLDLDTTLATIASAAGQLTGAALTAILLLDDDGALEFRACSGPLAVAVGQRVPANAGLVGRALEERSAVLISDLLAEPGRARPDLDKLSGVRSYIAAPLIWRGERLGVVTVGATTPGALGPLHAALVEELAEQAATAVGHARAYTREQTRRIETEALNEALAERTDQLERAHRQLLQNEKLSAIGQLASGIAHELNTPLGVILSNLSVLDQYARGLMDLGTVARQAVTQLRAGMPQATIADDLAVAAQGADLDYVLNDLPQLTAESIASVDRMASIVRSVAVFARQNSGTFSSVNIQEALESAITLVWSGLKQHADVVREFSALPAVYGQVPELVEVFVHVLLNAGQALSDSGRITIRTTYEAGEVVISITDTGSGIAAEQLSRIFDPFFTTRDPGQGMGMGLSVCHGIVTQHHGTIEVSSTPGSGTTVTVRLPAAASDGQLVASE